MKVPSRIVILLIKSLFLVSCIGQEQPVLPLHSEPLGTDWGRQYRMGELVLDDRCFQLQADEELLRRVKVVQPLPILPVWPEGFTWAKTKGTLEIINKAGEKVAKVGDRVRLSGAEVLPESHQGKQIAGSLPTACIGIYYLVGDDITVIEDDEPVIIPVPDTEINFKRRETQYLGFTPTEEPAYSYGRIPSTLTIENKCILLVSPDGEKYVPEWPAGFTPHLEDGQMEVRNGGGRRIARIGERLRIRGYIAQDSRGDLYVPECEALLLSVWGIINTDLPLAFLEYDDRWLPDPEQVEDSLRGYVDVHNGCMHINNHLLLWPSDYRMEEEGDIFRVTNANGEVVAQRGERYTLKGYRIRSDDKFGPEIIRMMPTDCPSRAYWIVTGHE